MKLEINGQEADYKGKIAITRQTFDANNLSVRLVDITNRFVLPKSDNNKKIIKGANRLESDALEVLYDSRIIDSFFLFNGMGILTESGNEWKFQLTDPSKAFFDGLSAKLNELDFEADSFVYGSTSYNTLKNLSSSVWVWPVVQMHESETATDLQYLRPHFSFWTILSAMFTSRGWSLSVDTSLLQNIGIQANENNFYFTSYQKTLSGDAIGDLTTKDFSNDVVITSTTIDLGTNKTAFKLRGLVSSDGVSSITFNDDEIALKDGLFDYDETTSELTGVVTITLNGTATFTDTLLYTLIRESSFDDLSTFDPTDFLVKAYDNLPDLKQIELFKDALTMTFSIIVPDSLNKSIQLVSLGGLNSQNKTDWSEKYIEDSETIKSRLKGLNKKNLLTYKNGVGDSSFNTSLEFLEDEKDYLSLRYAGSPDKEDYAIYNIYIVDADGNNVREASQGLRVVYIDGINGKFSPLNWSNLVAGFYENYFISLDKPKAIDAKFNLKKLDVLGFNPLELIYLDQYNNSFIVQQISQYVPGEATTVKLLKYGR